MINRDNANSIIRILAMVIVYIASLFGLELAEDTAWSIAIIIAMIALIIYCCVKMHSITPAQQVGQHTYEAVKREIITVEQVQDLLNQAIALNAEKVEHKNE